MYNIVKVETRCTNYTMYVLFYLYAEKPYYKAQLYYTKIWQRTDALDFVKVI